MARKQSKVGQLGRWLRLVLCTLPALAMMLCAAWPAAGQAAAVPHTRSRTDTVTAGTACAPTAGTIISVPYTSTVDGRELHFDEYLPASYTFTVAYPLVVLLPSIGGSATEYDANPAWQAAADAHGMILLTIEPRSIRGNANDRSTFYLDGVLAPGEQDVLDALPAEETRRPIDLDRVYIAGYSMGAVGALNIAAHMPGLFAGAAPGAPISDMFQEWAYIHGYGLDQLLGGQPGESVVTDSLWYEYSPRFLLPNLMHTPVYFVHGISDTFMPNALAVYPYMQSRHIVDTPGYSDTRGSATNLQQLGAVWPGAFVEQHLWPPVEHAQGESTSWLPGDILNFFDAQSMVTNPLTVALTTYDNRHTRAYWLQMQLVHPSSAMPALVYAMRDAGTNSATLRVTGSLTLTLDIAGMGLSSGLPLTLSVQPAAGPGPAGDVAIVLSGTWPSAYRVRKDGAPMPPGAYAYQPRQLTLLRQANDGTHTYVIATLATRAFLPLVGR